MSSTSSTIRLRTAHLLVVRGESRHKRLLADAFLPSRRRQLRPVSIPASRVSAAPTREWRPSLMGARSWTVAIPLHAAAAVGLTYSSAEE